MMKVGERRLKEVLVSVLFSQGTVRLGTPVILLGQVSSSNDDGYT